MKSRGKKDLVRIQGNQKPVLGTNDMILKIVSLALRVNTETEYCVFVDLSGHVGSVSVDISSSKKDYQEKIFYSDFMHYNELDSSEDDKLRNVIYQLEFILEHGKLDTEKLRERHSRVGYTL
ncbi:hypothetical protein OB975_25255 [Bacillus cereus]|nr:hypothetical protein [Bacillus cereus]MCU5315705.1 hypothetical protein [Bacillus cereus]MCU5481179.1 hypothetical protein [Bacillus cereus]